MYQVRCYFPSGTSLLAPWKQICTLTPPSMSRWTLSCRKSPAEKYHPLVLQCPQLSPLPFTAVAYPLCYPCVYFFRVRTGIIIIICPHMWKQQINMFPQALSVKQQTYSFFTRIQSHAAKTKILSHCSEQLAYQINQYYEAKTINLLFRNL